MEVTRISIERCLKRIRKLGIDSKRKGNLIKLETADDCWLAPLMCWGVLDLEYTPVAYVPTKGYLKKWADNIWLTHYEKRYDSVVKILEEEGFSFLYYTDVEEI